MNIREQELEAIDAKQGINLFSISDYINFYNQALDNKKRLIEIFKDRTRIIIPLSGSEYLDEYIEKEFKDSFKQQYKEKFGVKEPYFTLLGIMKNSTTFLGNKYQDGRKVTKVINAEPTLGEDVVLLYSQVKNSFIKPNESYLVLSIDPYDFIMMGVGKKWKTCYKPLGEHYSAGYSLANDRLAMLSYITTNITNPIIMNESKLYRRLCIFREKYNGVVISTQYPYKNSLFEEALINTITENIFPNREDIIVKSYNDNLSLYKKASTQIYNDFVLAPSNKKEHLYIGEPVKEKEIIRYGTIFKCIHHPDVIAFDDMPLCADCELEYFGEDWDDICKI